MQNFRALGAPPPDPPASGGWGFAPKPATSGGWGRSPQTPKTAPPLRISGYAPDESYKILQIYISPKSENLYSLLQRIKITINLCFLCFVLYYKLFSFFLFFLYVLYFYAWCVQ